MKTNHWTKTISVLLLSLGLFKPASGFAQMLSVQSGSAIDIAQPAQPDSIVQIVADSQGLVQLAPADLPIIGGGTFWWVMPGGDAVPAPCLPLDLSGAVYQIADGQYLVDETGGQVGVNTRRFGLQAQATSSTVASEVASQADAVVNLITQVQTAASNQQARATMQAMGMDVPSPGDDGNYAHYWTTNAPCYFSSSAGAGTYVNFYNTNDYALHSATFSWEYDQNHKPDDSIASYPGYHYNVSSLHPNGYYVQYGSGTNQFQNLNFPTNTYSIFAYCDQSRSYALGAEAGVQTLTRTLDLQTVWPVDTHPQGSYKEHVWHSAEFRSDAASRWGFWKTVLGNQGFNIK